MAATAYLRQPSACSQQHSEDQDRHVGPAHIGCGACIALHGASYNRGAELWRNMLHPSLRIDDRRHAGVGGTQHHAACFQRARLRDLQVLLGRQRTAEPRDIADIDEHGCLRQLAGDFGAEGVFVANVDCNFLPGDGI